MESLGAQQATRSAVVVGGGLAGIAAATKLVEQGLHVTVIEREAFWGGRAASFPDRLADGTPFQMERGFHAFFRHYKNVRALIRRVDPELSCLTPLADYPLLGPAGLMQSFVGLPAKPPLNVAALMWRSPHFSWRELVSADLDRAREMLEFDPDRTFERRDHQSAHDFLTALGFSQRARQMLFDVFAHSFFNPEGDYSAAELLSMFHFYFTGNDHGLVFDVAREPFGPAIFDPLTRYLRERGAVLLQEAECLSVQSSRSIGSAQSYAVLYRTRGEIQRVEAPQLVLALPVPALRSVVLGSPALAELQAGVGSLEVTLPFAVWRLWLDRSLAPGRPPFAGTTGLGLLDNISLYEKLEGESAAWAQRTGGSVVELHAYAVPEQLSEAEIRADLLRGLHQVYPEAKAARVVEERFLLRRDCPAFRPGSHALRPAVRSSKPGVMLAGDFVKLPFPSALMERAVTSGFLAANEILAGLGCETSPVEHGPTRGLLAPVAPLLEKAEHAARRRAERVD